MTFKQSADSLVTGLFCILFYLTIEVDTTVFYSPSLATGVTDQVNLMRKILQFLKKGHVKANFNL